jgi:glycosyltransferase involved in cell wall biosynthesis
MRIDFVITELNVGGAECCLTELATGLAGGGDQIRVMSIGSLPKGQQRALVDRIEAAGIEVRSCQADTIFQFARAYREIRRWLKASPPDVCQTFLFHANVLGTMAAKSANVAPRFGGIRVVDDRWLRRAVNRIVTPHMDRVVCVSSAVKQFALRQLGCHAEQTLTISNAVDVQRFCTAKDFQWSSIGWPDDANVALFVGRLDLQKGIDLLQNQVDAIAPPNTNRRLLLVGDGPMRATLKSWTQSIGADRVQLLDWQPDVAPLMRACRLLVLPSRFEGMPNVVLEAMAAGRPVVCSDVQGTAELLSHARPPQVFRSGNSDEMKNLVEQFMSNEALSVKIGEQNQTTARNEFSIAAMVDAYRILYRTVLTNRLDGA